MNQQTFECDAEHAAQADGVGFVVGDPMSPTLTPGDALGVRMGALPEIGDMVAVEHGGKVHVKRWGGELAGQVALGCDNPTYPAFFQVKAADLRVVGVVAWICRVKEDGRREFRQPALMNAENWKAFQTSAILPPRVARVPVFEFPGV